MRLSFLQKVWVLSDGSVIKNWFMKSSKIIAKPFDNNCHHDDQPTLPPPASNNDIILRRTRLDSLKGYYHRAYTVAKLLHETHNIEKKTPHVSPIKISSIYI